MDKYDKENIINLLNATKDKIYLKPISKELYKISCHSDLIIYRFNELKNIISKVVKYNSTQGDYLCKILEENVEMYEDNFEDLHLMYINEIQFNNEELNLLNLIRDGCELVMVEIEKIEEELSIYNNIILYPCSDCGKEERNPGLDCCGSCYDIRIWGK